MRFRPFQSFHRCFCRWFPSRSVPSHPLQACLSPEYDTIDVMGDPSDVRQFFEAYQEILWPEWKYADNANTDREHAIRHGCLTLVCRGPHYFGCDPWNSAMLNACTETGCYLTFSAIAPQFREEWDRRHRLFRIKPSVYGSHPVLHPSWTDPMSTENTRRFITSEGAKLIKPCPQHGTRGLDSATGKCRLCTTPATEPRK